MKFRSITPVAILVLSQVCTCLCAQPTAFTHRVESLELAEPIVPGPIDLDAVLTEDEQREQYGGPYRFAMARSVEVTPQADGIWDEIDEETLLWRLPIVSPAAISLSIGFTRYFMPPGGRLYIYTADESQVRGPFTENDNREHGELWTPLLYSDAIIVELTIPVSEVPQLDLELGYVNHGYRDVRLEQMVRKDLGDAAECNVNVACPEGNLWRDQIRAVARFQVARVGESPPALYWSTGTLINNTAQDGTPYLLTAFHSFDENPKDWILTDREKGYAATMVVYWNFESSTCEGTWASDDQSQTGGVLLAAYSATDFSLVELSEIPAQACDVFYAGWDRRDLAPSSGVAIHHPEGDLKKISIEQQPLSITSRLSTSTPGDGNYLRIADWDTGTTEGGSSGCPLFNPDNKRVVGQLSGGYAACGNNLSDWFGRIYKSWTGGGTRQTRLRDWLDPGNTGVTFLDGKNPGILPKAANPTPANGATNQPTTVSLSWSGGGSASSYDVYFGIDSTPDAGEFRRNQSGQTYNPGILQYNTTYYWRIDAKNAQGTTTGDIWRFTTGQAPPSKANNPTPANGATSQPTTVNLSWSGSGSATSYDVYFGTDSTPDAGEFKRNQSGQTYNPGTLLSNTTYYWRIDTKNGQGTTTGDVWRFATGQIPPSKATNPTPANGATNQPTTVNLSWSGGGGASSYDVYFGTDSTPDVGEFRLNQAGQTYSPAALQYDTTYYWRIDAKSTQETATGDVWRFTTTKPDGGVKGQYYHHYRATPPDPPSNAFMTHVLTRTDPQINFNWGDGSPDPSIQNNFFSAKWTGEIQPAFTETYTFYTTTDDGVKLWVDGQLIVDNWTHHRLTEDAGTIDLVAGRTYPLEMWWYEYGGGAIAELRWASPHTPKQLVPQSALSAPVRASSPDPLSGAMDVQGRPMLTWKPGDYAVSHGIYFGTNRESVRDATMASPEFKGTTVSASYIPRELAQATDYYWRIDEVNNMNPDSPWKGPVWSFTVADFILVEDFEDYDAAENQIWYSWHDGLGYGAPGTQPYFAGNGTGAIVGDETTPSTTEERIVHSGGQSMPFCFDNNIPGSAKYSEAKMTLYYPRDWTEGSVTLLSLWFRGHAASSFNEDPVGTYRMTASGADIWNYNDEFHYAYRQLTGAGTIIARVNSVQNTNQWAKAGVMIRDTLEGNSKFAAVYVTPGNGCRFQARLSTNELAQSDTLVSTAEQRDITAPYWVKLERSSSNDFRGYYSPDGSSWQAMSWNPQNIPMNSKVYVGLALTSHDVSQTCEANFSGVRFTGSVSSQWANQDIGIISNDPERMYVAIANRSRPPAVVYYHDPGAPRIDTWIEWIILLQDFADQGVNLSDVETIAIGFGTRGNTSAPGGAGTVYFDDIRLYRPR